MGSTQTPKPGVAQNTLADRQALPGLLPQETVIFKSWWKDHYGQYDSADFNIRVGTGYDPGSKVDPAVRKSTIAVSQRRIDALLHRVDGYTIVEVKYRASPLAIGQLLCYRELWNKDNSVLANPTLLLLCYQVDVDTVYCAIKLGVNIVQVQADFTGIKVLKQD